MRDSENPNFMPTERASNEYAPGREASHTEVGFPFCVTSGDVQKHCLRQTETLAQWL